MVIHRHRHGEQVGLAVARRQITTRPRDGLGRSDQRGTRAAAVTEEAPDHNQQQEDYEGCYLESRYRFEALIHEYSDPDLEDDHVPGVGGEAGLLPHVLLSLPEQLPQQIKIAVPMARGPIFNIHALDQIYY